MTTEQFLVHVRARPFKPFVIHMADGRSIRVSHPEAVAYGGGRTAAVATSRKTFEIVDLLLVPSLETEDAPASQGPQEQDAPV